MKIQLSGPITSVSNLKFIQCIDEIDLSTKKPNQDIADPKTDIYIKVRCTCLEYSCGEIAKKSCTRTFSLDLDKKIFFWNQLCDRYNATNHDEMYIEAEKAAIEGLKKLREIC